MFDTDKSHHRWLLIVLLVVVAAVYAKAVTFGHQMGFDDLNYLFTRPEVQNWWGTDWWQRLTTPEAGYWIPVPTFIYAHLRMLFPELYVHVVHGVNIGFHLLNVGLVYALASRWSDDRTLGLIVAAIWGLHPVHVESVAWLTSLKVLVYGTGMLGALLIWDRYLTGEGWWGRPIPAGLAVGGGFLLALGCKPEAVILPVLLVLVTWFRRREWRLSVSTYVVVALQLSAAAAYLPLAIFGQESVVTGLDVPYLSGHWFGRIFRAVEISARNLLFPIDVGPGNFARSQIPVVSMLPGLAITVACFTGGVALAMSRRWKLTFGLAFAVVTYLPYAQFKPIPRLAADSYLYLPAIGVSLVVGWALVGGIEAANRDRRRVQSWLAVVGIVVFLFAGKTQLEVGRWRDPVTLWKPVLVEKPTAWRPYFHLAEGYEDQGELERAASVLDLGLPYFRASRVYPVFMPPVYERLGHPHKAWKLAAESIARHRDPEASHYEIYLGLLARNDLELPTTDDVERLTGEAVDVVTGSETWMNDRANRVPLAQYFARHGHGEWALPFLRREFESERPHCAAWLAYRQLSDESAERLNSAPKLPDRCRSGAN